jgi:hypothetical protein
MANGSAATPLRSLVAGLTRRGIVQLTIVSAIAGLNDVLGMAGVGADKRKKQRRNRQKKRKKPSPPPPLATCLRSCAGKRCGEDGCGGSCGACAGGSVCDRGQCVAACCAAGTFCSDGYCMCSDSSSDFCSCPAGDVICQGAGCCQAEDMCITPTECFDGEICTCATQTCGAGNDVCREEFAFCGSGPIGSCGCFTRADGTAFCATMPSGHFCSTPSGHSECSSDAECGDDEVCANVGCCNPSVLPFAGRCVTPCASGEPGPMVRR